MGGLEARAESVVGEDVGGTCPGPPGCGESREAMAVGTQVSPPFKWVHTQGAGGAGSSLGPCHTIALPSPGTHSVRAEAQSPGLTLRLRKWSPRWPRVGAGPHGCQELDAGVGWLRSAG